jgi:hypothetical protein
LRRLSAGVEIKLEKVVDWLERERKMLRTDTSFLDGAFLAKIGNEDPHVFGPSRDERS